jgi:hypothetical protein
MPPTLSEVLAAVPAAMRVDEVEGLGAVDLLSASKPLVFLLTVAVALAGVNRVEHHDSPRQGAIFFGSPSSIRLLHR